MKKFLSRYPKITVFAFGEGDTEKEFLKHVRATYGRNTGVGNKIESGNGGGSDEIVDSTIKHSSILSYDRRFIVYDTDVIWTQKAKKKAWDNDIELISMTPCLEGFFLLLLEPKINIHGFSSQNCTKIFEKKYLNKEDKLDYRNYKKIFPLEKLEKLRKTNPILDRIIYLMTKI